ncbi:MAG: hypothetical protein WD847_12485 [Pirellulales bacterium]
MDVKEKIIKALAKSLRIDYIRLEDDDGISGYVVSSQFKDMPTLARQELIDDALGNAPDPLAPDERRQVLMIAGLTPIEYEAVGAPIRIHRIKELPGPTIEVFLHGGLSDAEYVRGALNNQKGVKTTEPTPVPGAPGVLMSFRAKGTRANPLTKQKAIRILKSDAYVAVMPNA